MRIETKFKALVINKTQSTGVKDTTKTYYNLVIATDTDGGSMSCTKEVYDSVGNMKPYEFKSVFDDKYGSMRIVDCEVPVSK